MFQEKDIEAFQDTKAPEELKNRIWLSVEEHRRKAKKRHMTLVASAACFALIFSLSGILGSNSTILSIDGKAVSNKAVQLQTSARNGLATASEGQDFDTVFFVPMEIEVTDIAHIEVSKGTLSKVGAEDSSQEITSMDISESTVIYWCVSGNTESSSTCTITTEDKEYVYVIEFDEEQSVFIMKQTK